MDQSPGDRLEKETSAGPISRDVTERSVSTLDLSIWTPEIQSGAGLFGVSVCMGLSAARARGLAYLSMEAETRKRSISFLPPRGGIHIVQTPRRVQNASCAGVAVLVFLLPDSRSAPSLGLEDKRTKCVNPMGF